MSTNIILGTMNINYPYSSNISATKEYYSKMIEKYIHYVGSKAILDTAYYYGNTTTEQLIGEILPDLSIIPEISTKVNPWYNNDFSNGHFGQLGKLALEKQFKISLNNMGILYSDYLFLHCYDYETSLEETLEVCDTLWRREKMINFGLSNFSMEQLKKTIYLCERKGFNLPNTYQGMYNVICRKVEEIFPLLDEYSIKFWAYNPLAGGLLTGKYHNYHHSDILENSRFKDNKIYQNIFWKEPILNKLEDFFLQGKCLDKSLYWLTNLSKLRNNDKVIIGASSIEQLEMNMNILNKREQFSEETNIFLNNIYPSISEFSPNYYY
jgi:aflatoxin B1 aldehyde reductase